MMRQKLRQFLPLLVKDVRTNTGNNRKSKLKLTSVQGYNGIAAFTVRKYSSNTNNIDCVTFGFPSDKSLPSTADVVVIGGGVVGTSTAYHLAKRGIDVVLLERHK